jgi:hypothetical protein
MRITETTEKVSRASETLKSLIYDYERLKDYETEQEYLDEMKETIKELDGLMDELQMDNIKRDQSILEFVEWVE